MKFLRDLIAKTKPNFEKGGKLEKWWPLYDGFETFLFVPGHATHKGSHIRDGVDLKRTMITVVLALVPCLLFGMYNAGYQHALATGQDPTDLVANLLFGAMKVLPLVIVSYTVGLAIEFGFCIYRKHGINEGFLVSGMLIPLVMPVEVPLWMVGVATAFAVIIGKEVFGGTGMNILNPALTARAFLFFAYPKSMSGTSVWASLDGMPAADSFTGETALAQGLTGGESALPAVQDMIVGLQLGSVGETSVIACLLGAALLLYTGIGSWRIMLSMVIGGLTMGFVFNGIAGLFPAGTYPFMEVSPWIHLIMGGFAFGCVFMATDPVSAAQTNTGKWIYGFFCGFFGICIRVFNPAYPEGIMMAILFMNVMAPLIDHYVIQSNIKKRLNRVKVA